MLGNVEHGRFERLRSGLTAVSALLTGAGGYFHGRGEAHNPGGWALAPRFAQQMASGAAMGVHGTVRRRQERVLTVGAVTDDA